MGGSMGQWARRQIKSEVSGYFKGILSFDGFSEGPGLLRGSRRLRPGTSWSCWRRTPARGGRRAAARTRCTPDQACPSTWCAVLGYAHYSQQGTPRIGKCSVCSLGVKVCGSRGGHHCNMQLAPQRVLCRHARCQQSAQQSQELCTLLQMGLPRYCLSSRQFVRSAVLCDVSISMHSLGKGFTQSLSLNGCMNYIYPAAKAVEDELYTSSSTSGRAF